jgi:hypothetical protein
MTTELDQLAQARPDFQHLLANTMTAHERTQLLKTITATPAPANSRRSRIRGAHPAPARRRWPAVAALVGAAAAAALLIEAALPAGTPGAPNAAAAATLHHLADLAVGNAGPVAGPHQFAYAEMSAAQYGGEPDSIRYRQWQAPNGDIWQQVISATVGRPPVGCYYAPYDAPPAPGNSGTYVGHNPQYPEFDHEPQAFLNGLPTDPSALRDYLSNHVQGGGPNSQLVFRAAVDLLTNGMSPPTLRAAAIRVLALDTRHVTVNDSARDAAGRSATELTFAFDRMSSDGPGATIQNSPGVSESLYFDPHTSQLLQESLIEQGHVDYVMTIAANHNTNSVPADILQCVATKAASGH